MTQAEDDGFGTGINVGRNFVDDPLCASRQNRGGQLLPPRPETFGHQTFVEAQPEAHGALNQGRVAARVDRASSQ